MTTLNEISKTPICTTTVQKGLGLEISRAESFLSKFKLHFITKALDQDDLRVSSAESALTETKKHFFSILSKLLGPRNAET